MTNTQIIPVESWEVFAGRCTYFLPLKPSSLCPFSANEEINSTLFIFRHLVDMSKRERASKLKISVNQIQNLKLLEVDICELMVSLISCSILFGELVYYYNIKYYILKKSIQWIYVHTYGASTLKDHYYHAHQTSHRKTKIKNRYHSSSFSRLKRIAGISVNLKTLSYKTEKLFPYLWN